MPTNAAESATQPAPEPRSQTPPVTNGDETPPDDAGLKNQPPPPYVQEALEDAERLLKYAAEIGTDIDPVVRDSVLRARDSVPDRWTKEIIENLLAALTQLATRLKPVTADSLKAFHDDETKVTFRTYRNMSIWLAIIIVLFSAITFVTTAISKSISADIVTANDLAARLRAQLGAEPAKTDSTAPDPSKPPQGQNPIDVITQLQQYAATIRAIEARTRQLSWFVLSVKMDPYRDMRATNSALVHQKFQLEVGLPDLWEATRERTDVYQRVRSFAQTVLDNVSILYGALLASVLPVLYALLGTCAYLLRSFEQQTTARTFTPSPAYSARFLIAIIGGAVVGLFNFTITQSASVPPLAIAFLVGYAVDVFFAFLEGMVQTFTKK